jgi:hypothetical protein
MRAPRTNQRVSRRISARLASARDSSSRIASTTFKEIDCEEISSPHVETRSSTARTRPFLTWRYRPSDSHDGFAVPSFEPDELEPAQSRISKSSTGARVVEPDDHAQYCVKRVVPSTRARTRGAVVLRPFRFLTWRRADRQPHRARRFVARTSLRKRQIPNARRYAETDIGCRVPTFSSSRGDI